MKKDKKLVIANWKMNPETTVEAKKLFLQIGKEASGLRNVETVVCAPFVFLSELKRVYKGGTLSLGAQDLFWENKGSYTGEISPTQLKNTGVRFVILGHSERRALWETNSDVNKKIKMALKQGFRVIFCVGEKERDRQGEHLQFLKEQLIEGLQKVSSKDMKNIIIAYEPIWAIGKTEEDAITPQSLHEMILFIRKILVTIYNKNIALDAKVIYGGSVERGNAHNILTEGTAEGFLVGHASLNTSEFGDILKIANSV